MARLSVTDRARIAGIMAGGKGRAILAEALASPLLRWRYRGSAAGQILIVPRDLRSGDPSFWSEARIGQFGFAGKTVTVVDGSPFEIAPPTLEWQAELHGFSWLRHLSETDEIEAAQFACDMIEDWLSRRAAHAKMAAHPDVIARRIMSWLSQAELIAEAATGPLYDAMLESLDTDLVVLSAKWRNASPGAPRLTCAIALCLGQLALSGHERQIGDAVVRLEDELKLQVVDTGGHISRNPADMVDILLDLLPLSHCFRGRDMAPPAILEHACQTLLLTLRHVQLGDGLIARFNGMGPPAAAEQATVLAYDDLTDETRPPPSLCRNGYVRLQAGDSIVVVDAGAPPPMEYASKAQAGCLSVEWSHGPQIILANAGAASVSAGNATMLARSTASHNTLQLADSSSAELVRHGGLETLFGGPALRGPSDVSIFSSGGSLDDLFEAGLPLSVEVSHDGYAARHALKHTRTVALSDDGRKLSGTDRLDGGAQIIRLPRDLPFAVYFHLYPGVTAQLTGPKRDVAIATPDGVNAIFKASGAAVSIEPGAFFADHIGPLSTQKIVLRGSTFGESDVSWTFEILGVA